MHAVRLTPGEARRIALAAQGFDRPRPERPDIRHVRRVMASTRLIQIDFVNVLVPAHYLVPFSRLGPYVTGRLDELVYGRHEWTEQWAHEASIIPMDLWPLLRYRMAQHVPRPRGFAAFLTKHSRYVDAVLERIDRDGPVAPDDLPPPAGVKSRLPDSWIGTVQRAVLEALFGQGHIASVGRRSNFARVYDLAERVIPPRHYRYQPDEAMSRRELLGRAAAACGVATEADLADYFRMPVGKARPRLVELVEEGVLQQVRIDGAGDALLHRDAKIPGRVSAAALLSPFDPLVWCRPRLRRLFDFDYRLEIFIPQAQRKWGYYVMPFLLNDTLVARVDLKADRSGCCLRVLAAYRENGARESAIVGPLAGELSRLAAWLGLDRVRVGRRGNLARALGKAAAAQQAL